MLETVASLHKILISFGANTVFMFQIPIGVEDISSLPYHPVKVGIADAFVIRHKDTEKNILYRIFYIYSTINISKDSVVNNVAVIFHPQLS